MQATVHLVDGVPGPQDNSWVDAVIAHLDATSHPSAGALVGRPIGLGPGAVVAFGRADPAGFTAGAVTAGPGTAYEIVRQRTGRGTGPARYLQLTTFTGRSPQWCAAFDRASEERIWPAVRNLPGLVDVLAGSTSDGGRVALTLAESVETLEAGAAAILSTELLPWEKPEHMTGPDGIAVLRLLHADVPAAAPTA
jgi:hypothetical protein